MDELQSKIVAHAKGAARKSWVLEAEVMVSSEALAEQRTENRRFMESASRYCVHCGCRIQSALRDTGVCRRRVVRRLQPPRCSARAIWKMIYGDSARFADRVALCVLTGWYPLELSRIPRDGAMGDQDGRDRTTIPPLGPYPRRPKH